MNVKMFRAVTSMYNVVKAKVRNGGDLTESFMCPSGLKQGEVCSPVLFYNTIQLYCLCVDKFAFWLVIYINTFNKINNKTSTTQ